MRFTYGCNSCDSVLTQQLQTHLELLPFSIIPHGSRGRNGIRQGAINARVNRLIQTRYGHHSLNQQPDFVWGFAKPTRKLTQRGLSTKLNVKLSSDFGQSPSCICQSRWNPDRSQTVVLPPLAFFEDPIPSVGGKSISQFRVELGRGMVQPHGTTLEQIKQVIGPQAGAVFFAHQLPHQPQISLSQPLLSSNSMAPDAFMLRIASVSRHGLPSYNLPTKDDFLFLGQKREFRGSIEPSGNGASRHNGVKVVTFQTIPDGYDEDMEHRTQDPTTHTEILTAVAAIEEKVKEVSKNLDRHQHQIDKAYDRLVVAEKTLAQVMAVALVMSVLMPIVMNMVNIKVQFGEPAPANLRKS